MARSFSCFVAAAISLAALVGFTFGGAAVPAQAQTPTVVYSFTGNGLPQNPYSWAMAQGRDGNLYGSADSTVSTGASAVFNVSPSGTLTVVANNVIDSYGVTLGTDGNFYSVTQLGGTDSVGEVFKVTPAGVITVLHNFTGGSDGSRPVSPPIQGTNGTFYGTTTSQAVPNSTVYSVTSAGVFKTLHTFTGSDGQDIFAPLVQGTDGNFYGATVSGGTSNDGVIFKMTPTGTVTVLHNFTGTDGSTGYWGLIQGSDGNFYGATNTGGTAGSGVIFKITSGGTYTVLYNFTSPANQNVPYSSLIQATNGKLYGVTSFVAGPFYFGTIYSITTSGTFTSLYSFANNTGGAQPSSPLRQHTNGLLYGSTYIDGDIGGCGSLEYDGEEVEVSGCGVIYSFDIGAKAFIRLQSTSGTVGAKVGIFGQGFSSSSVVKFNGVAAAAPTLSGTTYLTATVPAGATDGFVTVTTGSTILTSTVKYTVHNSWSSGTAIPVPVAGAATGFISGKIYVVGGFATYNAAPVSDNQIYNPSTNKWTTGAVIPTPVWGAASAVVSGALYVIGGYEGTSQTPSNLVQAYNPSTNTWTTKSAMLTARGSTAAAVDSNAIYVLGGNGSTLRLNTVEKYVPSTDTWTEEAPLLVGKSEPSAGLVGSTIVAADGFTTSGETGDNEGYTVSTNTWSSLTADPTPRNASCYGSLSSQLYVAGGYNNSSAMTTNDSYSVSSKKWTTQAAMPTAALWQGSAVDAGLLYCLGGQAGFAGAVIGNVQIYQP